METVDKIKLLHPFIVLPDNILGSTRPIIVIDKLTNIRYQTTLKNLLRGKELSIESCIEKTNLFVYKSQLLYGQKYDYSKAEYVSASSKLIIICPKHGEFEQRPDSHLGGKSCRGCHIEQFSITYDKFLDRAALKHGSKYTYTPRELKTQKDVVLINCSLHGSFKQAVISHLSGQGCPKCARINHPGSMPSVAKYEPNKIIYLYYMQLENNEGIFYKIGLTTTHPTKRIKNFKRLKSKKIIEFIEGKASELFKMEQDFKKYFLELGCNYYPKELASNGATECFKW